MTLVCGLMVKIECLGKYDECRHPVYCDYSAICIDKFLGEHANEIKEHKPWYERHLTNGRLEPESLELGICGCGPVMKRVLNLGDTSLCRECIKKLYNDANSKGQTVN